MKSHIRILSAVLLAVAFSVPALYAQSDLNVQMKVPFAFQYSAQRFAPGTCRMNMAGQFILVLRCGSTSAMAMVQLEVDPRPAGSAYALFRKHGDRYFLEQIWPGVHTHLTVYESQLEKRSAREVEAKGGGAPTLVEVALVQPVSPVKH